jgi:hypothetical protein
MPHVQFSVPKSRCFAVGAGADAVPVPVGAGADAVPVGAGAAAVPVLVGCGFGAACGCWPGATVGRAGAAASDCDVDADVTGATDGAGEAMGCDGDGAAEAGATADDSVGTALVAAFGSSSCWRSRRATSRGRSNA